jgi:hypothetical protein
MKGLKRFQNTGFDMRIVVYHSARIIFAAIVIAFAVKCAFIDTIRMTGSQMDPSIINGDRLMIYRLPFIPIVRNYFRPAYDKPVVVKNGSSLNVLRIAAASSDTIRIDSGKVFSTGHLPNIDVFSRSSDAPVPPDYAPRDFFDTYRIPGKNDLLILNKLPSRDFFFASSIIRQEHPKDSLFVKAYLLLDDSICANFSIVDFMFYKGSIDSVPDSLRYNWFFWNRLEEYLYQKYSDRKVTLYFSLFLGGIAIEEYTIKNDYYFLLADNRKNGLDSRYSGPVSRNSCLGRAVLVLWSRGPDEHGKQHFRFNRMGKIIS